MNLVVCRKCNRAIAAQARECPDCGHPRANSDTEARSQTIFRRLGSWMGRNPWIAAVLLVGVVSFILLVPVVLSPYDIVSRASSLIIGAMFCVLAVSRVVTVVMSDRDRPYDWKVVDWCVAGAIGLGNILSLAILISLMGSDSLWVLSMFAILSVPITVYAVYQYRKAEVPDGLGGMNALGMQLGYFLVFSSIVLLDGIPFNSNRIRIPERALTRPTTEATDEIPEVPWKRLPAPFLALIGVSIVQVCSRKAGIRQYKASITQ